MLRQHQCPNVSFHHVTVSSCPDSSRRSCVSSGRSSPSGATCQCLVSSCHRVTVSPCPLSSRRSCVSLGRSSPSGATCQCLVSSCHRVTVSSCHRVIVSLSPCPHSSRRSCASLGRSSPSGATCQCLVSSCHRVIVSSQLQEIMRQFGAVLSKRGDLAVPQQLLVFSSVWGSGVEAFVRCYAPGAVIVIKAPYEAAVYGRVRQVASPSGVGS